MKEKLPVGIVALDLDGTLLNSDRQVTRRTAQALQRVADMGIHVVPCTGRVLEVVPPEVLALPGVRYIVTAGGGAVFDLQKKECLAKNPLDTELALWVLQLVKSFDQLAECYTGEKVILAQSDLERSEEFFRDPQFLLLHGHGVPDLEEWVRQNEGKTVKLNLLFNDSVLRENVRQQLAARPEILLSAASKINLEVDAVGHGKGDTLVRLGALLGVPPEEIMAFGDELNDLNMLQRAGFSVAMANAVPELRQCARFVTAADNNHDGIAQMLEELVLRDGT